MSVAGSTRYTNRCPVPLSSSSTRTSPSTLEYHSSLRCRSVTVIETCEKPDIVGTRPIQEGEGQGRRHSARSHPMVKPSPKSRLDPASWRDLRPWPSKRRLGGATSIPATSFPVAALEDHTHSWPDGEGLINEGSRDAARARLSR